MHQTAAPHITFIAPDMRMSGAERHWSTLVPGIAERGLPTRLLLLNAEGPLTDVVRASGVEVACAQMRSEADLAGLRRMCALLRGQHTDVLVTRAISDQAVALAARSLLGAAHVHNDHDPIGPDGPTYSARQRSILKVVAPRVTRVVTVSSSKVDDLVSLGYPQGRIDVVPNGVPLHQQATPGARDSIRREFGFAATDVVFALVATLYARKRVDRFVRLVAAASEMNQNVRGLVVGDGEERDALVSLASELGGSTVFGGQRSDVRDVLEATDVVCLTSDLEVLPMAILEAMAAARPVIATGINGVEDAVVDRRTGIILRFDGHEERWTQSFLELAESPALRREYGAAGRRRALELFGVETMVDRYADALVDASRSRRKNAR